MITVDARRFSLLGAFVTAAAALVASGCPETIPPSLVNDAGVTTAGWSAEVEHLDGALLSMWGSTPNNLYAVGGPRGTPGLKTLVMHFDGAAWSRVDVAGTETFWWTHGTSATDIWMVGEKGRIARFDGTTLTETPSGTTATLYGVWAASKSDAWASGGSPGLGTAAPQDVLLHWDGQAWTPSPLPQTLGHTYFKVWGTSSENLYVVGEAGTIWHRVGTTWKLESDPPIAHGNLLTVIGCSKTEVYAVGGRDVLRSDGTTWTALDVALSNDISGVACNAPGDVVIVGSGGAKQRLVGGVWQDDFGTKPYSDLHGAWADGAGTFWAVGGNFVGPPGDAGASREGVIARYTRAAVDP
jgi:hypothetical protein